MCTPRRRGFRPCFLELLRASGSANNVERWDLGLRGLLYFVRIHTRPTVPRGRSAAALGGDGTVANILITCHVIRGGKGTVVVSLKPKF